MYAELVSDVFKPNLTLKSKAKSSPIKTGLPSRLAAMSQKPWKRKSENNRARNFIILSEGNKMHTKKIDYLA